MKTIKVKGYESVREIKGEVVQETKFFTCVQKYKEVVKDGLKVLVPTTRECFNKTDIIGIW